jgi:PKD repeat protein/photosystem II stability/assembly factor-like uncharacterized protein
MFRNGLVRKVLIVLLLLGSLFASLGIAREGFTPLASGASAQVQTSSTFDAFAPVTPTGGWILMDGRLYWTADNGNNWSDITPALPTTATIQAVNFPDVNTGWVLWSDTAVDGSLAVRLSQTVDGGLNWAVLLVQSLPPDDPDFYIETASMDWLDENTGWVSLKRQTGANFSAGTLFHTTDGGRSWRRYSPPLGGPVYFVNGQVGWMTGGPANTQLYQTLDGGLTWEDVALPAGTETQISALYPPAFSSPENGVLALVALQGEAYQAFFFSTTNGGRTWSQVSTMPLGSKNGWLSLASLDPTGLVASVPNDNLMLQTANGEIRTLTNQDGMSAAITDLQMLTLTIGWAKWNTSTCEKGPVNSDGSFEVSCTAETRLIATMNGGLTWETLSLPDNAPRTLVTTSSTTSTARVGAAISQLANTVQWQGQGFDICGTPTTDQLEVWTDESPYVYAPMNLYIGGSMRATGCNFSLLTASYITELRTQGWTFIPTWVGPQAPCRNFRDTFSYDTSQAYLEGIDEANLAVEALASLGLTSADKSGSIVYYDLEAFGDDQACLAAAKSFMNGWVTQLHLRGNYAGVYGGTLCPSGLNNYLQIANIPDAIWPANWTSDTRDNSETVWTAGCISTSSWANHQRVRQYSGGHNETYGGVTLNIDNDVVDGILAVPPTTTVPPAPSAAFSASPRSGQAPLAVTFAITNTSNMTACSWNYGDGQTGTSCASSHTHTYTSAGTFTVSLTASGPGGSDSQTHSNYITVTLPPEPSLPDLVPFPRPGRSNPLSLSSVVGTTTDGTLYSGQPTYIDWGFKNIGAATAVNAFYVDLYIDDQLFVHYSFSNIPADASAGADDWAVTWDTPGTHKVKLVVDPGNTVTETNEANNTWEANFYWNAELPTAPVPLAPTGLIADTTPTFQWVPLTWIQSYELYVESLVAGGSFFTVTNMPPSYYCTPSLCTYYRLSPLPLGDYHFKVGAKNLFGITVYSDWMPFTIGTAESITLSGNTGVGGVTLSYENDGPRTATSAGDGTYIFTVPYGWSGTVVPAKTAYTFSPDHIAYSNVQASQSGQNYTATHEPVTISGNVGVEGATLSYEDGSPKTVTSASDGAYAITVPYGWSGTVVPAKTAYTFSPDNIAYSNVQASLSGQSYVATHDPVTISGNAGIVGAFLSYSDGSHKTVAANSSGNYTVTVPYNWSGTIAPSKTDYSFIPPFRSYTNITENKMNEDFTAVLNHKYFLPLIVR